MMAADAAADARTAQEQADSLSNDVDRLLMITEALWTLLKKQNGYDDDVLENLINEIDMRDGHLDGHMPKAPPQPCPYCGKMLARHRPTCLYCGKAILQDPFTR
jgi:hypothetical protein